VDSRDAYSLICDVFVERVTRFALLAISIARATAWN